ncbi:hypothetical protein OH77DRAFT_1426235 [Trametes cingulata]|nr:hypothetical protein OH77DRAFT_1426235 [Trametes cingulata]
MSELGARSTAPSTCHTITAFACSHERLTIASMNSTPPSHGWGTGHIELYSEGGQEYPLDLLNPLRSESN